MIVDGKSIAREILAETKSAVEALGRVPRVLAIAVSPNKATESYLKVKEARAKDAGMELVVVRFPDTVTETELIARIDEATEDAIIVQLPLPSYLDTKRILDAIPPRKDADVLGSATRDAFIGDRDTFLWPPVVHAVAQILTRAGATPYAMRAAVVGDGWLVGNPVAAWLSAKGAEVTVVTRSSGALKDALKVADLVVSGAGQGGLITPDMVKDGAILIDAGTSESGGEVVGDMDPACALKASVFTPVPGGVGPIAVACLFANAAALLKVTP